MNGRYPPATWADGATPTTAELRDWLHAHDPEVHDARVAANMILGMLRDAQRVRAQLEHDLELRTGSVRRYSRLALRYRAAWLSARRRARRPQGVPPGQTPGL